MNCILAVKRQLEQNQLSSWTVPRKRRNQVFDFKKQWFVCSETADEDKKKKINNLESKDQVVKKATDRDDTLEELVKNSFALWFN